MTQWFGSPWNPWCCTPEDRVELPRGTMCDGCGELLLLGSDGVVLPLASPNPAECRLLYYHLDCHLKRILPHGKDCPHCRGREIREHADDCAMRVSGDYCSCILLGDL